ncbi:hypothetical protein P7C70_g6835, partial [Phenoliferia sp. Uapishka_3]
MGSRVRSTPLLTFPPSTLLNAPYESRFNQTFPLPASRFSKALSHLPLVFIFGVISFSFYAYFVELVVIYLFLHRHKHFKGFLLGAAYLWLAAGCTSSVAVAYLRSGGDVPGYRSGSEPGRTRDLEEGERKPVQDRMRRKSAMEDDDDTPLGENDGLLSRQAAEDAEDERLEREERMKEERKNRGKMVARGPTTRPKMLGERTEAMDMVAALKDLDGPTSLTPWDEYDWDSSAAGGSVQVKSDGRARFCRKCQVDKPDRAHHCSSCGKCVLKMDHHCPWLGGACVGYNNYKAFLLFLWYGGILGLFVGGTTIVELMNFVEDSPDVSRLKLAMLSARPKAHCSFAELRAGAHKLGSRHGNTLVSKCWSLLMEITLQLLGFIFGFCMSLFGLYHLYLACHNRTTLESMERSSYAVLPPTPTTSWRRFKTDDVLTRSERNRLKRAGEKYNCYDVGTKENLRQIFGGWERKWWWAVPFGKTPGDGTAFPIDKEKLRRLREVTTQIRLQVDSGGTGGADNESSGVEELKIREVDVVLPGPDEVLLRVEWTGVNFIGVYPHPTPLTIGNEPSGEIVAVGKNVKHVSVGDKAVCFGSSGGYAEYYLGSGSLVSRLPDGISTKEAASCFLQGITALTNVLEAHEVAKGETVLVHAAAGGVGALLTQLCTHLGATVIGTTSTEAKAEVARKAGAAHVVLYGDRDLKEVVKDILALSPDGEGVHAIFDGVGKDTFLYDFQLIRRKGTMVILGAASGKVPPYDIMLGQPSHPVTLADFGFMTPQSFVPDAQLEDGYPFTNKGVQQAHLDLSGRGTTGKLVIRVAA